MVGLCQKHKPQHPHHMKLSPWGRKWEKTRLTESEVGRQQHQGVDRIGVGKVPRAMESREKMDETGCKIICGGPATPADKG